MSTDLNIHLSPEAFVALQRAALVAGRTPDDEAAAALEQKFGPPVAGTSQSDQQARESFERHFGSVRSGQSEADSPAGGIEEFFGAVRFGYRNGVTNEQIDADLAREYGQTHDGD